MKLTIWHKFPSLNEYITAERTNRYKAAKMKKELTTIVMMMAIRERIPKHKAVWLKFTWVEKNKRRDPDNLIFNQKFALDGLVHAGVIKNDGWDEVKGIKHRWEIGKDYGVEIEIVEVEE